MTLKHLSCHVRQVSVFKKDCPGRESDQGMGTGQVNSTVQRRLHCTREDATVHQHIDRLTPREIQVAELLIVGLSNKEIGNELHLSERTVQTHLSNIFDKLRIDNRTEAAILLLDEEGFVSLADAKTAILERIKTGKTRIEYRWR